MTCQAHEHCNGGHSHDHHHPPCRGDEGEEDEDVLEQQALGK
jgi:hypothetical protein